MSTTDAWAAAMFGEPEDAEPAADVNDQFRERLIASSAPPNPFDLRDRGVINPTKP